MRFLCPDGGEDCNQVRSEDLNRTRAWANAATALSVAGLAAGAVGWRLRSEREDASEVVGYCSETGCGAGLTGTF